jgi:hypothetical protein
MADTKISALTAVTTPASTDEFAVNQGGASKKITLAQILNGTVPGAVPIGGIILWSGTIASIATGFALCDGTANSPGPDLRDRFIVGARQDDAGAPKTNVTGSLTVSGGAATHNHTATAAAVSAHTLSTNVAVSTHSLTTDVALSAHSLTTNVAIADHTLTTSQGRTSSASTRAFVTTTSLTHTITQPVVGAHNITQPVVGDHTITQPVVAAHSITQPTISTESGLPPYYALAYIQRMT